MPKKIVNTDSPGPFHISARSINKEWFNIPMVEVWNVFSYHLPLLTFAFNFKIHSFVLMSNHYHLIVSTPGFNLSEGMAYFQREVSRELNRQGNRINRTFAGRYYKCNLKKHHHFINCYKYVYQNPIRAGLTKNCEDYPFSTLRGLLGLNYLSIPIIEDHLLFNGELSTNIDWLNQQPTKEDLDSIRSALKKGEFKLRKDLATRKQNRLEAGKL